MNNEMGCNGLMPKELIQTSVFTQLYPHYDGRNVIVGLLFVISFFPRDFLIFLQPFSTLVSILLLRVLLELLTVDLKSSILLIVLVLVMLIHQLNDFLFPHLSLTLKNSSIFAVATIRDGWVCDRSGAELLVMDLVLGVLLLTISFQK
jgi:hypothetical protein